MTDTANAEVSDEVRNEVVVTVGGRDVRIPLDSLSLTMDSSERDVLNAIRTVVQSRENVDIQDDTGVFSFSVRKALNSNTIYVYPKPVAG